MKLRQNEKAILRQKEFTDTLINGLPGIFYLYDHEWRLIRWNRNHETLTGFSSEEMHERPVLDWFSPPYKEVIASTVRRVFAEGQGTIEAPLLLKDGSEVPYVFNGVRLEIKGEYYFLGVGIDISARKAKETALLRSEQQLRLITDSLPAMIAYIDSGQRYLWVNKNYEEWWDLRLGSLQGKHIRDFVGEDIYAKIHQHIETVLTGKTVTFEVVMTDLSARPRDMLVMYTPDCEETTVRGFFVSIHDITDLKQAKSEADRSRDALAHASRVSIMAELATSMAHELNQPLAAILSNAQAGLRFLRSNDPDLKEIEEIFTDIVTDDKRAGGVIQQMRAFLRKDIPKHELLDVNNIINNVLEMLHSEVIIQGVSIKTDLAADLPCVQGDRIQLEQVLINLIVNAEQAMSDIQADSRALTIKTSKDPEGSVAVCIQDSGPGIPEDMLERIFEPFHTTKTGGIGMGLAISRAIIEANAGRIWAENAPGCGARFCMVLSTGDQA